MSVTIKEVASRAGVSVATVSKVLNHSDYGSQKTRQRVLAVVEEMKYRPHAIARSLVVKQSQTIGLVLPDLLNPVFPAVARGVEHGARKYGYNVLLCNTDREAAVESVYIRMFLEKRVDGIIFFAALSKDDIVLLRDQNISVVIVERPSDVPDSDLILLDNEQGAYQAVQHLLGLGHKQIGLVIGNVNGEIERNRYLGYKKALTEVGIPLESRYVRVCDYHVDDAKRAADELLRLRQRPTAIFAACDIMAVGTLRAAEGRGLRVPNDLSLVGFDDTLSQFTSPPITTISQPLYEMGREAVRILVHRLRHPEQNVQQRIVFGPQLVVRQSTASIGVGAGVANATVPRVISVGADSVGG